MKECEDCEIKKFYAKAFDIHWLDEYDCPCICGYTQEFVDINTVTEEKEEQ